MSSNRNDCAICLDPPTNPAMTPCTHIFCRRCIGPWLDNHSACPICRHRITRGRRALVTVRETSSPRRAISAPARPSPRASQLSQPPRVRDRSPVQQPSTRTVVGRGTASRGAAAARRSSATVTVSGTGRLTTTTTTSRGNSTRGRPAAGGEGSGAAAAAASRTLLRRCTFYCTPAERRLFRDSGEPCSCMRAQDRVDRQRALDNNPPPRTTATAEYRVNTATQSRSAPSSRRNSSSDESVDVSFELQIERAIFASRESATDRTAASGPGSPFDEALRKAIADSLAEARSNTEGANGVDDDGSPETRIATASSANGVTGRDPRAAAAASGTDGRSEDPAVNPGDVFLRALGTIFGGVDVDLSGGAVTADIGPIMDDALALAGVSQPARRVVRRLLGGVMGRDGRGPERAIASNGSRHDDDDDDDNDEDDDAIFVSLAEVKTTLSGFGISAGTIHSLCGTLRRFALS